MDKYTLARSSISLALESAKSSAIDASELIDALLVCVIEKSTKLRGTRLTRDSLTYELSNLKGEADFDFIRSR